MVCVGVQEGSRSRVRIWDEGPQCRDPCRFCKRCCFGSGASGPADAEAVLTPDLDQEVRSSRILVLVSGLDLVLALFVFLILVLVFTLVCVPGFGLDQ